jgi:hypothetical protein
MGTYQGLELPLTHCVHFVTRKVVVSLDEKRASIAKGIFLPPVRRITLSESVAELVIQAILVSHVSGMGLAKANLKRGFVRLSAAALRRNRRIRVFREGDQTEFIELAVR